MQDLDLDPLILMTGPRRVGKSVMLKQIINYLIEEKGVKPEQILFYEFSPNNQLEDLRQVYELYHD